MKQYTITVFTENETGLLQRVVTIFTRRHISIKSLTTSQSSNPDIYRFTIVVNVTEDVVQKLVAQLDKQVDIIKAFYYTNKNIVHQEIALYKIPTAAFMGDDKVENLIRSHNARILSIEKDYIVVEKTGHEYETTALLKDLEKIAIFEFVRSGRIAIPKVMEPLNNYLRSLEITEESQGV